MSEVLSNCAVCKKLALMMCQRCSEGYCSSDCQYADWNRHKYYCIPMPALVPFNRNRKPSVQQRLNSFKENSSATFEVVPKINVNVNEKAEDVPKLSNDWKTSFELPVNEDFDCFVLHISEDWDNIIWVFDKRIESNLKEMVNYIRQCFENNALESAERVSVGELYIAVIGTQAQRVEVIESDLQSQEALVRLIDCGKTINVNWNYLYMAKPKMAETKAFAVCVKIQREHDISVGNVISCRLIGTKNREGILLAQVKPKNEIDEGLIKLLQNKQNVQLIKLSPDAHFALVKISYTDEIIGKLGDQMEDIKLVCDVKLNAGKPILLSARCANGWRRALLIDQVEEHNIYLVYEVDEGNFSICREVWGMPTQLRSQPHCVFAISMNGNPETINEEQFKKLGNLSIQLITNGENNKCKCLLYGNNDPLCEVTAFACVGQMKTVGPLVATKKILDGDTVHITHAVNYAEVYVNTVESKQYDRFYEAVGAKCPFYKDEKLMVGDIVLIQATEGYFYRAKVILLAGDKSTTYNVFDLDTGKSHLVSYNCLRKANDFVKYLPTSLLRVKLSKLCNIPHISVPEDSQALYDLEKHIVMGVEFKIHFQNHKTSEVNLLFNNGVDLFVELLSTLFTPHAAELKDSTTKIDPVMDNISPVALSNKHDKLALESACNVEQTVSFMDDESNRKSLPPSPSDSPAHSVKDIQINVDVEPTFERFTKADIKIIKIPTGDNIKLTIFDRGQYETKGLLTGCYLADEKEMVCFDNHRKSEDQYGICPHLDRPANYVPNEQELCLAQFDIDNKWYRAVCLRHEGDDIIIQYLDYGNLQKISPKKCLPLPKDMLYPSYNNTCYIKGYNEEKIKAIVAQRFAQQPSIWNVDDIGNDIYQIQIPEIYLK